MGHDQDPEDFRDISRREFIAASTLVSGAALAATADLEAAPASAAPEVACALTINKTPYDLKLEPRTTLLDLLREHLNLVGSKKGCDHGQCGACTVLVNGERVLSCLTLAVTCDAANITTIEGLATGDDLHPVQTAFLHNDGFQCGFCTPGQICSAVAMLEEARRGMPSAVTTDLKSSAHLTLTVDEVRERMAGNICRCGAYPNIIASVLAAASAGARA
ncbi:MAG TPA: 2Fe-2S iron-sulfur cluster-binding protein [Bryobacteraceae bacterium]|jgi:xanthine dehydrogenase YagT iron-sulfur-binding subunit